MNGIMERFNQTLWNVVRIILHDQDRDGLMWPWTYRHANNILNTQKTVAVPNNTPYTAWHTRHGHTAV